MEWSVNRSGGGKVQHGYLHPPDSGKVDSCKKGAGQSPRCSLKPEDNDIVSSRALERVVGVFYLVIVGEIDLGHVSCKLRSRCWTVVDR